MGGAHPPEMGMLVDVQAPRQILYLAGMDAAVCIHITVYIHPVYCYQQTYSAIVRSFLLSSGGKHAVTQAVPCQHSHAACVRRKWARACGQDMLESGCPSWGSNIHVRSHFLRSVTLELG